MEGNELEGQDYQIGINAKNQQQQMAVSGYPRGQKGLPGQKYQKDGNVPTDYQQQPESGLQQEGLEGQNYQMGEYEQNLYQQQIKDAQLQEMNRNSNYCPIHGSDKKGNKFGQNIKYIHEQVNNALGENEEEADNYKFYESKNITRKVENISSINVQNYEQNVNSLNTLNIRNMPGQDDLMRTGNVIGMSQEVQGTQGLLGMQGISSSQGMQGLFSSQGNDTSKIYIATRVTPVYSEIVNQNIQNLISGHICNVCGNPIRQGQINSSQQIVYSTSNNICPIHGKTVNQQQYSDY